MGVRLKTNLLEDPERLLLEGQMGTYLWKGRPLTFVQWFFVLIL
jgi:hypothetical protein